MAATSQEVTFNDREFLHRILSIYNSEKGENRKKYSFFPGVGFSSFSNIVYKLVNNHKAFDENGRLKDGELAKFVEQINKVADKIEYKTDREKLTHILVRILKNHYLNKPVNEDSKLNSDEFTQASGNYGANHLETALRSKRIQSQNATYSRKWFIHKPGCTLEIRSGINPPVIKFINLSLYQLFAAATPNSKTFKDNDTFQTATKEIVGFTQFNSENDKAYTALIEKQHSNFAMVMLMTLVTNESDFENHNFGIDRLSRVAFYDAESWPCENKKLATFDVKQMNFADILGSIPYKNKATIEQAMASSQQFKKELAKSIVFLKVFPREIIKARLEKALTNIPITEFEDPQQFKENTSNSISKLINAVGKNIDTLYENLQKDDEFKSLMEEVTLDDLLVDIAFTQHGKGINYLGKEGISKLSENFGQLHRDLSTQQQLDK